MDTYHGTTIVSVRRGSLVALGGDGQVTIGNLVAKSTAKKVRKLHHQRVLAGFAGATCARATARVPALKVARVSALSERWKDRLQRDLRIRRTMGARVRPVGAEPRF